jgi:D-arabinose 1-dehydrogenase-like Zn-dependent alcohol dehydrogenase
MRAVVYEGPEEVSLADVDEPGTVIGHEIVGRVSAAGEAARRPVTGPSWPW